MAIGDIQYILNKLTTNDGINLINNDISIKEEIIGGLINIFSEQWRLGDWNSLSTTNRVTVVDSERPFIKNGLKVRIHNSNYTNYQWFCALLANKNATSYIDIISWLTVEEYEFTATQDCYLAIVIAKTATGDLTPQEVANNVKFSINYPSNYTGYYPSLLPKTNAYIGSIGNTIANGAFNLLIRNVHIQTSITTTYNLDTNVSFINGHKYFVSALNLPTTCYLQTDGVQGIARVNGNNAYNAVIGTANSSFAAIPYLYNTSGAAISIDIYVNIIDLTAMFGASNEPTTVADFRAMFPASYYPYNSGSFGDLLWTNASPSSSFAQQTININLSSYKFILIICRDTTGSASYKSNILIIDYIDTLLSTASGKLIKRNIAVNQTYIAFGEGLNIDTYGVATSDDTKLIPYKIYGIR